MRTSLTTCLRLATCLRIWLTNTIKKGGANRVYLRDKRRHPGQEVAEVQQDVEGHGDNPTNQTVVGLLNFCSNLLTYLGTALLWSCRRTKNNANSEAPLGSALGSAVVVAARTSQNSPSTHSGE